MSAPLLRVADLATVFETDEGTLRAVDGISFDLEEGRTLGLVGESGCGKSVTSLSIMGLLPETATIERGRIELEGKDITRLSERELRSLRGARMSMIFQEPSSALNPVYRVGYQIEETLTAHLGLRGAAARARVIELLTKVGIPAPAERVDAYPHQLSGGMRQRVMIAMALACGPKLLIADEPTTALDVTVQAQILELLGSLQRELGMAMVLITHDLGVVSELADEVGVMYAGRIVERSPAHLIFEDPRHPYTRGLLRSVPSIASNLGAARLPTIPGTVVDLRKLPAGCRFRARCPYASEQCAEIDPPLAEHGGRLVACIRADEIPALDHLPQRDEPATASSSAAIEPEVSG